MNKTTLIAITSVTCASLTFFAVRAFLPREEIRLDQTNKIFIANGDARIKKAAAGSEWQQMSSATVLEKGDTIETSSGSTADIVIGKDTDRSIKVKENSRLEVQGINPTNLNLSQGEILVALKKLDPKSSFTVRTPTAICGARGTAWLEKADAQKTKICVFENDVFIRTLNASGNPGFKKHVAPEGAKVTVLRGKPLQEDMNIDEGDLAYWKYWGKNVQFLRAGKVLVNDFDRKENFNNLGGPFGSWNVFYSDPTQHCKDELTDTERVGSSGYSVRIDYDVSSIFSAYNGFFTNLMWIDLSDYKYLVFSVKGDKAIGFTNNFNVELKNRSQIGRLNVNGITDQWQRMVLPMNKFAGINNFKEMKEMVIVFADITASQKEGVVYIDDIYFSIEKPV